MAHKGLKYECGRDIKDVAKLVRADLRAAIKAGLLPKGFKAGVRISRYAGGCSLDVDVRVCPGLEVYTRQYVGADENTRAYWSTPENGRRFTAAALELIDFLERTVNAYNRKDTDSMTDYYNVDFHTDVSLAFEMRQASLVETQARMADARDAAPAELCELQSLAQLERERERLAMTGWLWEPYHGRLVAERERYDAHDHEAETFDGYAESRERWEAEGKARAVLAALPTPSVVH